MPRSLKHLIPFLLLAGAMLGGASLANANSGHDNFAHGHEQPSEGACAYACILKGHGQHDYSDCGECVCKG